METTTAHAKDTVQGQGQRRRAIPEALAGSGRRSSSTGSSCCQPSSAAATGSALLTQKKGRLHGQRELVVGHLPADRPLPCSLRQGRLGGCFVAGRQLEHLLELRLQVATLGVQRSGVGPRSSGGGEGGLGSGAPAVSRGAALAAQQVGGGQATQQRCHQQHGQQLRAPQTALGSLEHASVGAVRRGALRRGGSQGVGLGAAEGGTLTAALWQQEGTAKRRSRAAAAPASSILQLPAAGRLPAQQAPPARRPPGQV